MDPVYEIEDKYGATLAIDKSGEIIYIECQQSHDEGLEIASVALTFVQVQTLIQELQKVIS